MMTKDVCDITDDHESATISVLIIPVLVIGTVIVKIYTNAPFQAIIGNPRKLKSNKYKPPTVKLQLSANKKATFFF